MPRFTPGSPTFVVQNVPGAGGLTLANRLFTTLPRDGSVLSILQRGTAQLAIAGDPAARFDPLELTWLGSISSYQDDVYLLIVNREFAAQSLNDLKGSGGPTARLGASGPGATNRTFPLIARTLFGLRLEVVRGYTGAPAISLAQLGREVDGQVTSLSYLKANQASEWKAQEMRALLAFGRTTRHPELPDVPTAYELISDQQAKALLKFAELPFYMAMPVAAPPKIPDDRRNVLVKAFNEMVADQEFVNEGKKLHLDISPISAEALTRIIAEATSTPPEIIARYNAIAGEKQ
ncbi:MAG: tripartite tricarboxylate transporter substrate-binding protein [Beijerinckiaceae bacterium]|nr:tripartite tricarboxylate transporter substrate-binding protein [Beijerinckiaceae bacterium]